MPKPTFFIVGAVKEGTTALYHTLKNHPEIYLSEKVKETHFFSTDIDQNLFREEFKARINKGSKKHQQFITDQKEYLRLFDPATRIAGEVCASYLYSKDAAKGIYNFNPKAKIIMLLRNPVERAFSHFNMDARMGFAKNQSFIEAYKADKLNPEKAWGNAALYYELGCYSHQIKRYLNCFEDEQILIKKYDDLLNDSSAFLNDVFRFLEVETLNISIEWKNTSVGLLNKLLLKMKLKSKVKASNAFKELDANDYNFVLSDFLDDIEETEKITGLDLGNWKKLKA